MPGFLTSRNATLIIEFGYDHFSPHHAFQQSESSHLNNTLAFIHNSQHYFIRIINDNVLILSFVMHLIS